MRLDYSPRLSGVLPIVFVWGKFTTNARYVRPLRFAKGQCAIINTSRRPKRSCVLRTPARICPSVEESAVSPHGSVTRRAGRKFLSAEAPIGKGR